MKIITTIFAVLLCIAPAFAAERPYEKIIFNVFLDSQTPQRVAFTRNYQDLTPSENVQMGSFLQQPQSDAAPRPDYMRRASVLSRKLRDLFGTRVALTGLDMTQREATLWIGLSVESGRPVDAEKFGEFQKFLSKNEVVTAIRSGDPFFNGYDGKVDDKSLLLLSQAFPEIRRVELYGCPVTGTAWDSIGNWPSLEVLTVIGANLSDESAEPITNLTELTKLDMGDSSMRAGDIQYLSKLPKLVWLAYRIDDADAKWIGGMKQLRELYLPGSPLTDAGLKQLAGLTNLVSLDLKGTAITDDGLVALQGMKKLTFVNLDNTKINGSGLGALTEMPLQGGLNMQGTLLTGQKWMEHVPNFKSYNQLMMVTRNSKITPAEEATILKMLPKFSQALLNR